VESDVLYESPWREDVFYARFQVRNESGSTIGVDLGGADGGVRPVQYSGQDMPYMTVIDILTPIPPVLTDSLAEAVGAAFASGGLEEIGPGGSLDCYGMFDGSGRRDIEELEGSWLLLAHSGWIVVTDGRTAEVITPEEGFVCIPARLPVAWSSLPQE
jgi:hypothetical protein